MKRLKRIVAVIFVVGVLLLAIGFLLPSRPVVQRSVVTTASPQSLFPLIASPKRWEEWTAWNTTRFADMKTRFEGPDSGVGAIMIAEGKSSGNGKVTVTRAEPDKGVWYDLDFEHGMQIFHCSITFAPAGNAQRVTWALEGEMGNNPVRRWVGPFLDKLMGRDLATGLANIKTKAEAAKP